ncbi:DUF262 domain-containing protein [Marinirhabdus gelatinilytica]|uniref:GmrSD restriction endonucleases N-terminal domain-containing protein n=1 Tax=Marinirhabdus gelatinilytica TaxID=1703343 RepID=A0A370QLG6_9FLAO|nr:DUF262 domain-containing protein [Marinirhabdus gelatinilytica]RDK89213.1 hypothetical protein C8D94_1011094 [Marinirhabdus gelatinilytica]
MGSTSSNAQNRELADWYRKIKNGNIKLPRFQRMEAWDRGRIESYLETIVQNLPIGITLILNVGSQEKFISRYISTAEPETEDKVTEHLLDGQQRLTSFWRALNNNYESETYFVYFPEFEDYDDYPYNDEITIFCRTRYLKKGQKYPLWADSPKQSLKRGFVPTHLFRPEEIQSEIDSWIDEATKHLEPKDSEPDALSKFKKYTKFQKDLTLRINKLRETIAHFNLPYLSLPESTPKDIALQVFINMNTNSKPLSIYDIIVAEVESEMKSSLHDLQANLDIKHPKLKDYFELEFLILATSALLQDKLPNHRGMAEMDKSILVSNWDTLENCLGRMAEFMESQGIYDKARLPTNAVLSVISAAFSQIPESGDLAGKGEILLKKYLWSSFFTNRYENSAASRAFQDFINLKRVLNDKLKENSEPYTEKDIPVLNRKLYPLVEKEELWTIDWPKRVNIRARAILAISTYLGGYDFADGKPVSRKNIKKREYHHIFPDALLSEAEIDGDVALNCALITGKTNRNIGRKDPLKYLSERYDWAEREIVHSRLSSHLIPIEELANGGYEGLEKEERLSKIYEDYESFLEKRADYVMSAIEALVSGKQIYADAIIKDDFKLPPALENLNKEIEQIEISIRDLVNERLLAVSDNPFYQFVPERTRQSAEGKINSHIKKFPGESLNNYQSFRKKLNFFTLGEFKDLIIKKDCWSQFEDTFKSKPNLENRFNQLFTLRNQIAHNNDLNDILVKDGEAAIMWFKSILN